MARRISLGLSATAALVLVSASLLAAAPAIAADPASDFTYSLSGSSASITGYTGGNAAVDIPATIVDGGTTYTVTAIGENAFINETAVTSVTFPDTVIVIGANAFAGAGLTSVTIPDSVTTIGVGAFNALSLTTLTLGDSVTSIGAYAFSGSELTSVTIPDSVTTIAEGAFVGNSIASLTLGDSLTSVGFGSFQGNALTSVTIPGTVTSIAEFAFYGNPLSSVIFAGDAPTTFTGPGGSGSFGTGTSMTIYRYPSAAGFTAPSWIAYTIRVISSAESELNSSPAGSVTADGTGSFTLAATVRDDTHSPVDGVPVVFTIPSGVTGSAAECTTVGGSCAITLTSLAAATYSITARVGGDPALLTSNVTFIAAPDTGTGGGTGTGTDTDVTDTDAAGTLPATGLDAGAPASLAGGLLAFGLGLLAFALVRRRRALRRELP